MLKEVESDMMSLETNQTKNESLLVKTGNPTMARMSEILMSEPSMRTAVTLVVKSTSTGTNYYTLKYRGRPYVITPLDGQTSIDSATHFFRTHGVRILGWASTDDGIVLMMPYNATNRLARIFQVGR